MQRLFSALLLSLVILTGCINRPDYVLSEEQMVDLLVDVHKSEGLMDVQHANLTSAQQRDVMSTVLAKHNVTKERYDSSLIWYANNLKLLIRVYSHVDEELNKEFDYWGEEIAKIRDFGISEAGDSVELWTQREYMVLDKRRNTSAKTWTLNPDSNFIASDQLTWHMRVLNLSKGQTLIAAMSMDRGTMDNNRLQPVATVYKTLNYEQLNNGKGEIVMRLQAPADVKNFPSTKLNITLITDTLITKQTTPVFVDQLSLMRVHR